MSVQRRGFAATANGQRYVEQLVKHWSHKLVCSIAGGVADIAFRAGVSARFAAGEDGIAIDLLAPDTDTADRIKEVIERHVDRFAFREGPLAYRWEGAA
jgi:hypothetical protein